MSHQDRLSNVCASLRRAWDPVHCACGACLLPPLGPLPLSPSQMLKIRPVALQIIFQYKGVSSIRLGQHHWNCDDEEDWESNCSQTDAEHWDSSVYSRVFLQPSSARLWESWNRYMASTEALCEHWCYIPRPFHILGDSKGIKLRQGQQAVTHALHSVTCHLLQALKMSFNAWHIMMD